MRTRASSVLNNVSNNSFGSLPSEQSSSFCLDWSRRMTGNAVLDALPKEDFERLLPHLAAISFVPCQMIYGPGEEEAFVYFPLDATFSINMLLRDGASIEVGAVGREGLIGLSALLGDGLAMHEITALAAGRSLRAAASVVRHEIAQSAALRDRVLKVAQFGIAEISQIAACNGRHDLRSRFARWLLTLRDKLATDRLAVSQEMIASALGVQRTGVTAIAQEFRQKGYIDYKHGSIAIIYGTGLELAACECYVAMKERRDRVLRGLA